MSSLSKSLAESLNKSGWLEPLKSSFESDTYRDLRKFLLDRYKTTNVYPAPQEVFRALIDTPFDSVKVVIIGQDPYHSPGTATGLAFGVKNGKPIPPSLRNIFKEVESDLSIKLAEGSSDLSGWARQGVLLLNSILTVEESMANSHAGMGWEEFTDDIIRVLVSREKKDTIFLLWGEYAEKKGRLLPRSGVFVLKAPHPSPMSANKGFIGCKHFSQVNDILEKTNQSPINWSLVDSTPHGDFGKLLFAMGLLPQHT